MMCACVCAQSCPGLCDPMDSIACQALLFMELSRQEYWSGLPSPSPGYLPNLGIKLMSLASPAFSGRFFTTESTGKPLWDMVEAIQSRCTTPGQWSEKRIVTTAKVLQSEWGVWAPSKTPPPGESVPGRWAPRTSALMASRGWICFPGDSAVKNLPEIQKTWRCGFNPWIWKIPWTRKWEPTPVSCLANPMDRGSWWTTVHGVTKSQTRLSE